ncbi:MAG: XdhC family protein [Hyphomicrobium sp.]|uniref:XdhC family protein n=1 Tax=Hyphomicrobium sp. TaxID=82 RepID=UPI003D10D907
MKAALLGRLVADRAARRPAALVTDLDSGIQALIHEDGVAGALALDDAALAAGRAALAADRSGLLPLSGRRLFLQAVVPSPRLILVGAVHIAQALAPMAALAGYGVTVVDPRRSFATDARFPAFELTTEWPDEALARLAPDARTAIVTLTHDPKLDDAALGIALNSPAFYIGSLGSRKTHAARLKRLTEAGFNDAALARIHGPVGIAIGALSPAEIALSVLAQITAVRRAGSKPGEERAA